MELGDRKYGQEGQEQHESEEIHDKQNDLKHKQLQVELRVANITRWCIQQY